jgi:hypothetical protein
MQSSGDSTNGRLSHLQLLSWSRPFRLSGFGKASYVAVFARGKDAQEVAVSNGTKSFRAVAIVAEAAGGEDQRPKLAVFGIQALKRGESNAISAIEVVEGFKEFGFALVVRMTPVWVTPVRVFGLGVYLLCGFGAGNFRNSHGLPASIAGQLRLGRGAT